MDLLVGEDFLEIPSLAQGVEIGVIDECRVVEAGGAGLLQPRHGVVGLGMRFPNRTCELIACTDYGGSDCAHAAAM
jgi:hypothetical protein